MRLVAIAAAFLALSSAAPAHAAFPAAQQVVDGIAARIEDDIITLSQVRELAAYQQLVDGQAEPRDQLLSELIEQWIVNNEATSAHFSAPADSEVNREVKQIENHFPSPQAYSDRLAAVGITPQTVRGIVAKQIYLARYLDYKFRPAIQVNDADIEKYYQEQLMPALAAKKEPVPPLDQVREQIREVLVEQGISSRATSWFDDTKSRLSIEIEPSPDGPQTIPGKKS